jgi:hypothetical protein
MKPERFATRSGRLRACGGEIKSAMPVEYAGVSEIQEKSPFDRPDELLRDKWFTARSLSSGFVSPGALTAFKKLFRGCHNRAPSWTLNSVMGTGFDNA